MTIYLVKWKSKTTGENYYYACSSYVKANKKIAEINKNSDYEIIESISDGVPCKTCSYKLKGQQETIDFLNNVLFNDTMVVCTSGTSAKRFFFDSVDTSKSEAIVH